MTGEFETKDVKSTFALKNLKDREWNNKTYAELDDRWKRRIRNAVLNTTVIEDISFRPKVVHDLFHRLNTGGMPLTDQEIRNCVYSGFFNRQLHELNTNPQWRLLLGKPAPDRRLRDTELVLRFFALLFNLDDYKPSMREFLSSFQEQNRDNKEFLAPNKSIFDKTVNLIISEIGPNAFKIASTVNKSVCDSLMVSIAQIFLSNKEPKNVKENYQKLIKDQSYITYVTSGTSQESNVNGRINLARNYFLGVR